jgi:hypothetical protein
MPWSTITVDEVLEQFTPGEQAVLQNIQGASDTLDKILFRTVRAARGSIAAGGNALGDTDTIPDQVRNDVISLARWTWLTSFPALKSMQTDGRKVAASDAQTRLDNIANGKAKVEVPVSGDVSTVPTQKPKFGTRGVDQAGRDFNRTTQDG